MNSGVDIMTNQDFLDVLKNINEDLQQIKIPNLFDVTEGNLSRAQQMKQDLVHKIAETRKSIREQDDLSNV